MPRAALGLAAVLVAVVPLRTAVGQPTHPDEGTDVLPDRGSVEGDQAEAVSAEEGDPHARVGIVVLAGPGVDAPTADSLAEVVVAGVAARTDGSIVGKEELMVRLGNESDALRCISSSACLARVGVELGLSELIAGSVVRRGGLWAFHLDRIDIRTAAVVSRTLEEVDGDLSALAAAISSSLDALYPDTDDDSDEVQPSGGGALPPTALEQDARVVMPERSGESGDGAPEESGPAVSPLVWIGSVVAAASLGVGIYYGLSSQREAAAATRAESIERVADRRRQARIANASFGVGAAGLVTAVVGLLVGVRSTADEADGSGVRVRVEGATRGAIVQLGGAM